MENNRGGYRIANFETRKRVKKKEEKKKNRFIFFTTTFKACYVIRFTRFLFVALLFDLFVMVRNFLPPFNICCPSPLPLPSAFIPLPPLLQMQYHGSHVVIRSSGLHLCAASNISSECTLLFEYTVNAMQCNVNKISPIYRAVSRKEHWFRYKSNYPLGELRKK